MTPLLQAARMAPATTIDDLSGGGDVLLLAPHPDDETLGCGGAIAALTEAGRKVQVVVVTDGCRSHPRSRLYPAERLRQLRADEVQQAVAILTGGRGPAPILLNYPDAATPEDDAAIAAIADRIVPLISETTTALWAAWGSDPHHDHINVARIAAALAARLPHLAYWSYPIWGRFLEQIPTFNPTLMAAFDTQDWQDRKAKAVAAHASQMSGLIPDDPGGFVMSDILQQHFITTPELFLREGAA